MARHKIVNVASVPKRSPFRYAGGKTWLVPQARKWWQAIAYRGNSDLVLIEPFAGGGIIGLTAAFEGFADHVVLVEKDADVVAVWKCICSPGYEWLCDRILSFQVSEDNVRAVLDDDADDVRARAFRTIIKNRMYHGGILAPGSSLMKSGENGKGLKSRWYAKTLSNRISAIGEIRDRFTVIEGDALEVIEEHRNESQALFFIDPPYTAAGKKAGSRLYRHSDLDHPGLFDLVNSVSGDFLMTYDNAAGVVEMAEQRGFDIEPIAMKNTHHARMTELLIGRDLSWARKNTRPERQFELNFD